ncbi:MAG TPA: hypothetical protein VGL23_14560 [Chloroflexota bacterium]
MLSRATVYPHSTASTAWAAEATASAILRGSSAMYSLGQRQAE